MFHAPKCTKDFGHKNYLKEFLFKCSVVSVVISIVSLSLRVNFVYHTNVLPHCIRSTLLVVARNFPGKHCSKERKDFWVDKRKKDVVAVEPSWYSINRSTVTVRWYSIGVQKNKKKKKASYRNSHKVFKVLRDR